MLLKYLGEMGRNYPLTAAVSVCAPLRLEICVHRINQGFSRLYQWRLLKRMQQGLLRKYQHHNYQQIIGLQMDNVPKLDDFLKFDNAFTAPIHEFSDAMDYYNKASARQYLSDIHCPTLVIQAFDDPFTTPAVLPKEAELSPNVLLEVSNNGGHVGFITGKPWRPRFWLEDRIPKFFLKYVNA